MIKVSEIIFLPHSDAQFELQQVVLTMYCIVCIDLLLRDWLTISNM